MTYRMIPGGEMRLTAVFTDNTGTKHNPTTVTLEVKTPDGTVTPYTPTNDATGMYHYDFAITQSGIHTYKFIGTGAINAAYEDNFNVFVPVIPN